MAILRRVLYIDALGSVLVSVSLAFAPSFMLTSVFGQPQYPDYAVVRLFGVCLFVLALFMVLVAQRIDDLWWWSWAFVILEFGGAAVATFHALFGVAEGAAAWPWWLLAAASWSLCFGLLWGLGRTGQERPPP